MLKKLGLIAGEGILPRHIYDSCYKRGIECVAITLESSFDPEIFNDIKHVSIPNYSISKIISILHKESVNDIVLAGRIKHQHVSRLLLDSKGNKLLSNLLRNGFNDDVILTAILNFFEKEGFKVIPVPEIIPDFITKTGNITGTKLAKNTLVDIEQGRRMLQEIASFDIGQALVIHNGLVLGVETIEGTDSLISRCSEIINPDISHPILIKISKPNQDQRVDFPCLELKMIERLYHFGFAGVAIEANKSIIIQKDETLALAKELDIFIYGV